MQADLDALALEVDAAVGGDYLPAITASCVYDGTFVRGLELIVDISSSSAVHAGPGTGGSSPMPGNVSLVLTARTGFTGRSARGRVYSVGVDQSAVATAGHATTGYVNSMNAFGSDILSIFSLASWHYVVLSRFSGGVKRPLATHLTVTTLGPRNNEFDSQRGRLVAGH